MRVGARLSFVVGVWPGGFVPGEGVGWEQPLAAMLTATIQRKIMVASWPSGLATRAK